MSQPSRAIVRRPESLIFSAAVTAIVACAPGPARAQSGPPPASAPAGPGAPNLPGFAFGAPAGEAVLAVLAVASNATSSLPQRVTDWGPDAPRAYDRTADVLSDVTGAYGGAVLSLGGGYALETAYFEEAGVRSSGVYALRSSLVDLEAAMFTRGAVDLLKRLTGRCRPRHYLSGACETEVRDAFPSGHTAPMAALASARLSLAAQSAGPSGFRWASWGATETLALVTAYLRVRAGAHSWTDVGAGFVIGHAIGALVAVAHPMMAVSAGDWGGSPATGSAAASLRGGPARDGGEGEGGRGAGSGFGITWSGQF